MGLIYRWQGQKNFKLRDSNNQSIVEFLGFGNQMVMPPSIHPETKRPYVADTNLWEVLDKVLPAPLDLEVQLRAALEPVMGKRGLSLSQAGRAAPTEIVPPGERDIQMIRYAGYLARVVLGIDKQAKFPLAEALTHMHTWVVEKTARQAGDDMDPNKGTSKLLEFLLKDVEKGRTLPNGWDEGLTEAQRANPAIAEMIAKNEVQRWEYEKARDWLRAQVAVNPDSTNHRIRKTAELVELLAADENFSEADFKTLYPVFKDALGEARATKSDLVKQFKEARASDLDVAEDQEAIARQVYEDICRGGQLIHAQEQFWQWSGSAFKRMDEADIVDRVASDIKGNVLSRRYNDYVAVTKTIALIARDEIIASNDPGVNFANGFLTTDLKLHDHSVKFGQTFTMPFDYIPARAGEAHKWLAFLEDCWGEDKDYDEKVMALQEAFAATMFGLAPKYQTAFLLYGPGGTGKTTVLEVLSMMMPADGQSAVPPQLWGERFQQQPMVGKSLNVCGELPESTLIDGDKFKAVVDGSMQQTELKGKPIFNYRPTAAQWFASNFLPRSRDTSEGFNRRWLILEFSRVVPVEKRIVNFHEMLVAEEREAIAAWAVQGLDRLVRQRNYTQPFSHTTLINLVRRANNSVISFLQSTDKVRPEEGASADMRAIFDHYIIYMREISRGWSVTYERFRQMMRDAGYLTSTYIDGVGIERELVLGLQLKQVVLP
jgi:P4 family phage/plasmid primase-like protien